MKTNSLTGIRAWIFHLVSILISALFLLPLLWMFAASLRQPGLPPPQTVEWLPEPVSWSNYARIFKLLPLGRYLFNSLMVAGMAVPLTLLTASLSGFAMAQLAQRARNRLIVLSVVLLLIPITAVWLARFMLYRELGLFNSHAALILPSLMGSSPLFVLLFYWNFRRIPAELFEAARMDGAGHLRFLFQIALPLCRAPLLTVGMFTFIGSWNSLAWPLLVTNTPEWRPISVGLQQFVSEAGPEVHLQMAGAVIATAPVLLIYFLVQKEFTEGISLSGLKA